MNKNKEKSKKKVTRSFYLIIIASAAFGAFLSIGTMILRKPLADILPGVYLALQQISPWIFHVLAALTLFFSFWFLQKAKRICRNWNGEEEEAFYERTDRLLNWSMGISNLGTILLITWFGFVAVSGFQGQCNAYLFIWTAFLLVVSIILLALLQRKCVEQVKLLNPEKRGDALDIRFQKDWIESCDEQEQLSIYRASYKAFSAIPMVCLFLFVLLVLLLPYLHIGFLPFFCVGLLWLVPTGVFLRESNRRKKKG